MGNDLLGSTMNSYYNMRPIDIANKTLKLNPAEQTGISFAKRNQSEDGASQKKIKKPNKISYEGLSKDQIRQLKKEKR